MMVTAMIDTYHLPSRLRRMTKRRMKIALTKQVYATLHPFVGRPITPELRAEMVQALNTKFGVLT